MSALGFELRGVSKSFGSHAVLKGVSLAIAPGAPIALLGPSGCGKSTLLRILAGLEAPDSGQVLLDGKMATEACHTLIPPHRRDTTMVFQDLALWPNLTALENVTLGLAGTRPSRPQALQQATESLRLCGIVDLKNRLPGSLSGGQQQRVALARALAPQPRFLFLDEPFGGIDIATKTQLLRDIQALASCTQTSITVVTHDLLEALGFCETAVVLDEGHIVARGNLRELIESSPLGFFKAFRDRVAGVAPRASVTPPLKS
jgi:ABC-type Fe3+/spermidine/putrescine transport system ATPase subunit